MKIKGTPVNYFKQYLKKNLTTEEFYKFIDLLPEKSKEIYSKEIYATDVYQLYDAIIIPNIKAAELFFDGNAEKLAYDSAKYSAHNAVKTIFKILARISSLSILVKQAKVVFNSFYIGGEANMKEQSNEKVVLELLGHSKAEELNIIRISAWIEGFFEALGRKTKSVSYQIEEDKDDKLKALIFINFK